MKNNQAIFFLGAGFSMNFRMTSWSSFIFDLIDKLEKEIKKPQTNFKFENKDNKLVLKDLANIKNKIENNIIKMDYALDMVYSCLEINPPNFEKEMHRTKTEFIKDVYLTNFRIASEILDNKKAKLTNLNECIKKIEHKLLYFNALILFDNLSNFKKEDIIEIKKAYNFCLDNIDKNEMNIFKNIEIFKKQFDLIQKNIEFLNRNSFD